jgi:hypothetical protein
MQEMLPVGAFVRRRVVPVLDAFFPSPFLPFILILFILLSFIAFPFFCSRANQGTLPWRGDQWWQRYPQVLSQK